MPAELFTEDYRFIERSLRLNAGEVVRLARLFADLGVEKIRLTGGEPLLRPDLVEVVAGIAGLGGVRDLALTTNGVLLPRHAKSLAAAGLQRITVSLDSMDPDIFAQMSGGRGELNQVLAGIDAAIEAGLAPVKINAVVQRGVNDTGVLDLLSHFRGSGVIVRLIEYMDVGNRNGWQPAEVVSSAELVDRVSARWPLEPLDARYPGEVARRYRYRDGGGEIGLISSVTQPFCGGCNRARLSSDGILYTCLFAGAGHDLKSLLRGGADDATLVAAIDAVWRARDDRYSELRSRSAEAAAEEKVEMYRIGG